MIKLGKYPDREEQILWTMKGNFSDELIYGMIIGANSIFGTRTENDELLNELYIFEAYSPKEGTMTDLIHEAIFRHIMTKENIKNNKDVLNYRYNVFVNQVLFGFNAMEWLQGFITMANAMQVPFERLLSNVFDRQSGRQYHIAI